MIAISKLMDENFSDMFPKKSNRFCWTMTEAEFHDVLMKYMTGLVRKHNPEAKYIIDDNNRKVIRQMYYYLIASPEFKGDLTKGLLFVGDYGCGKTTLAMFIMWLYEKAYNKVSVFLNTADIRRLISKNELFENPRVNIEKAPIILDELGREPQKVLNYGSDIYPIEEVMQKRTDNQAFTIATSNYKLESLSKIYGDYVGDRIRQMMNIIHLEGKSRRL